MPVGRHDNPQPRAGLDIDMGEHTALTDLAQLRQPVEQGGADLGALADQDQDLGIAQPFGQSVGVLNIVVPDGDGVACQLGEARQMAHRVVIVVEDRDVHASLHQWFRDRA